MRILLIDQFGEMGGAQRCLVEATMGFAARQWEVRALVPAGPLHDALRPYCREVLDFACGPFASAQKTWGDAAKFARQLPGQAAKIARTIAQNGIDMVFVNGPRVLPPAALGCVLVGRKRPPLIYHSHWMVPQSSAAALARASLRSSGAHAIATSRLAAEWFQGSVNPARISTIYNGVAGFGIAPRPREVVRHVAILGRISLEKGQLEFVRAAGIAVSGYDFHASRLRFTICGGQMFAGDGYMAQVQSAAAGLPVEFREWTEDVGAFLAGVDLLVVPSQPIDNIPRVILEAFAARVPVLAFASGAIPELVQHLETGLLLRERSPEALAKALLAAAASPDLLNQIAARAYEMWQERYTLCRFQSEISEAVEAASRCKRQRRPLTSTGASAPA